jgi:hypothetical protein
VWDAESGFDVVVVVSVMTDMVRTGMVVVKIARIMGMVMVRMVVRMVRMGVMIVVMA